MSCGAIFHGLKPVATCLRPSGAGSLGGLDGAHAQRMDYPFRVGGVGGVTIPGAALRLPPSTFEQAFSLQFALLALNTHEDRGHQ